MCLSVPEPKGKTFEVKRGAFIGDNVTLTMIEGDTWYAALNHGHFGVKMHRSDDRGVTWKEIATPAYPPQPEPEKTPFGTELEWSTSLVWALATQPDRDGTIWGGT